MKYEKKNEIINAVKFTPSSNFAKCINELGCSYPYRYTSIINCMCSLEIGIGEHGLNDGGVLLNFLKGDWYVIRDNNDNLTAIKADEFESQYQSLGGDVLGPSPIPGICTRLANTIISSLQENYSDWDEIADVISAGLRNSIS